MEREYAHADVRRERVRDGVPPRDRRDVNRSFRRGIELDATWQPSASLHLRTAANLSRNRIGEWTQFYDVYDDAGNIVGNKALVFHDVNPLLTPPLLISEAIEYAPSSR